MSWDVFPRKFTSQQALDLTGVSYRQLDYWTRSGRVTLDDQDSISPGSGIHRVLSFADLVMLSVMKVAADAGISVARSSELAAKAKEEFSSDDIAKYSRYVEVVTGPLEINVDVTAIVVGLRQQIQSADTEASQLSQIPVPS